MGARSGGANMVFVSLEADMIAQWICAVLWDGEALFTDSSLPTLHPSQIGAVQGTA